MNKTKKHCLVLMRHGKSDWLSKTGSDFDRPLNRRGYRDAGDMGQWLNAQGRIPDRIVTSPARRALDSAHLVARALGFADQELVVDPGIYQASLDSLLRSLCRHLPGTKTLLLIGHNPGLDELLCYLSCDPPEYTHTGKLMTTASLALLHSNVPGPELTAASWTLEGIQRPRRG